MGWQWIAGSGAYATPYFRIFNPVTQTEKFDHNGHYVREWVPELTALPDKWLNQPCLGPEDILAQANVILDTTYPRPTVDLKDSQERALLAFERLN